ncbi:hypothetical protein [Rugamonas sp.]|uniref:hypothetical protein n=1 Tax=Rugamonas sp. TaxID=1926287 RepID=UPI0025DE9E43|nr:hypothetical protein [Rugamonas sp.]
MTKKKQPAVPKTAEAPAGRVENPFQDAGFYGRMRDYTERDAMFSKELRSIGESGAGKRNTDARYATSLDTLRDITKKGLKLDDMLVRIVQGVESGLWEPWLAAFGFELRGVNYAKTGARNARLALDLSLASKAQGLFANAGVPNWRSLVAEDSLQIQIEKPTEKTPAQAYAIFFLDAEPG